MHGSSSQTSTALRAQRPTLQRCLLWLAATPWAVGLCLAAAPSAQALYFTDGPPSTNPFYYNITDNNPNTPPFTPIDPGVNSSWTQGFGGEGGYVNLLPDLLPVNTSIFFYSSTEGIDTFTSGITNQSYNILFNYTFTVVPDEGLINATAYYQICGDSTCSVLSDEGNFGESGNNNYLDLASGQYLRFGIINNDTGGDLTISSFSATPVPSPLPVAGLGLAALGIYRAGRRKSRATPK